MALPPRFTWSTTSMWPRAVDEVLSMVEGARQFMCSQSGSIAGQVTCIHTAVVDHPSHGWCRWQRFFGTVTRTR